MPAKTPVAGSFRHASVTLLGPAQMLQETFQISCEDTLERQHGDLKFIENVYGQLMVIAI